MVLELRFDMFCSWVAGTCAEIYASIEQTKKIVINNVNGKCKRNKEGDREKGHLGGKLKAAFAHREIFFFVWFSSPYSLSPLFGVIFCSFCAHNN